MDNPDFFDREFKNLIKACHETLVSRYEYKIKMGKPPAILTSLGRFEAVYKKTTPSDHFIYFESIFNECRTSILGKLDDTWLVDGKVIIQYGSHCGSKLDSKLQQIKIELSDIYITALKLKAEEEERTKEMGSTIVCDIHEIVRPNYILLYIMRLFYSLANESEKTNLKLQIKQLESQLSLDATLKTPFVEVINPQAAQAAGGISSIFEMALGFMKGVGITPPEGLKPPSEADVMSTINGLFNNESTQKTMSGIFSSLGNCDNLADAIQTVVKNISKPETMDIIHQTVMEGNNFNNNSQPDFQQFPQYPQQPQQNFQQYPQQSQQNFQYPPQQNFQYPPQQ